MSTNSAATQDSPTSFLLVRIVTSVAALIVTSYFARIFYDTFLGPLSRFPGPNLRAVSKLPGIYTTVTGRDASVRSTLHEKYGPVVRVNPTELSFNSGAEAWDAIYGFKRQKPIRDPQFYAVGVNGCPDVVSADEENHSRQRKILSTGFSDKAIRGYEPLLKSWTQKMITKMSEQAEKAGKVDILKYLNCTTFDIMGDLAFGEGLDMLEDGELSPWVQTIFAGFKAGTFWRCVMQYSTITNWLVVKLLFSSKQVRQKQWENFQYCQSRMDKRLAREPAHSDLWSKTLAKSERAETLTRDEYHSNAVTFMVAGTETTATALSGLTYLLHQSENRHALDKLRTEVHGSFFSLEEVTLDGLARLEYMHAVIQEGLRLYPPAPSQLPRRTPHGVKPVVAPPDYPNDNDTNAVAFSILKPVESKAQAYVDEILACKNSDGIIQVHLDPNRPRIAPEVTANILALFYIYGRGHEVQHDLKFLEEAMALEEYQESRYYFLPEPLFFYTWRFLCMASGSSALTGINDKRLPTELHTLRGHLARRVTARIGAAEDNALCVATRLLICQSLAIANPTEVQILLDLQQHDGSLGHAWYVRYGSIGVKISHRAMACVFAVEALRRVGKQSMANGAPVVNGVNGYKIGILGIPA